MAILLGVAETGLVLLADARGLFTLNGWLPWQRVHGLARVLLGLGFVVCLPIAVTVYLAQATRRYLRARQIHAQRASMRAHRAQPIPAAPPISPAGEADPLTQPAEAEPRVRRVPVLSSPAPITTPAPPPAAAPAREIAPGEPPTWPEAAWRAPGLARARQDERERLTARVVLVAGVLLALALAVMGGVLLAFTGAGHRLSPAVAPVSTPPGSAGASAAATIPAPSPSATAAGTGGPSAQAAITVTPGIIATATPAPQTQASAAAILQAVRNTQIHDARFVLTVQTAIAGVPATGSGTGAFTTQPERSRCDLSAIANGQRLAISVIADASSDAVYARLRGSSLPGLPGGRWFQLPPGAVSLVGVPQLGNYAALTEPELIGPTWVDGVAVWHLRGGALGIADTVEDLYVRQENDLPVMMTLNATGIAPAYLRADFTAFNTGLTISLPS